MHVLCSLLVEKYTFSLYFSHASTGTSLFVFVCATNCLFETDNKMWKQTPLNSMDNARTQDQKCSPLYTKTGNTSTNQYQRQNGNTFIDFSTQNRYQRCQTRLRKRRKPAYIQSPPTPIVEQVSKLVRPMTLDSRIH